MFIFSSVAVAFTTCRLVSLRFSAATESPYLERERSVYFCRCQYKGTVNRFFHSRFRYDNFFYSAVCFAKVNC
jgi:hypothetical protein